MPSVDDASPYDAAFYREQGGLSARSARAVVPTIVQWVRPASVVDVGCGVGTWLEAFAAEGVDDLQGLDGNQVDQSLLRIDASQFRRTDLRSPANLGRRFDLVVSLEVAEHLDQQHAPAFVQGLAELSDTVLFSAAIPDQTGVGHVNEQWPSYWANLFAGHGYVVADLLRPLLWNDERIAYWYRQNLLLFGTPASMDLVRRRAHTLDLAATGTVLPLVHPEAFAARPSVRPRPTTRSLVKELLRRAVPVGKTS